MHCLTADPGVIQTADVQSAREQRKLDKRERKTLRKEAKVVREAAEREAIASAAARAAAKEQKLARKLAKREAKTPRQKAKQAAANLGETVLESHDIQAENMKPSQSTPETPVTAPSSAPGPSVVGTDHTVRMQTVPPAGPTSQEGFQHHPGGAEVSTSSISKEAVHAAAGAQTGLTKRQLKRLRKRTEAEGSNGKATLQTAGAVDGSKLPQPRFVDVSRQTEAAMPTVRQAVSLVDIEASSEIPQVNTASEDKRQRKKAKKLKREKAEKESVRHEAMLSEVRARAPPEAALVKASGDESGSMGLPAMAAVATVAAAIQDESNPSLQALNPDTIIAPVNDKRALKLAKNSAQREAKLLARARPSDTQAKPPEGTFSEDGIESAGPTELLREALLRKQPIGCVSQRTATV